MSSQPVLFETFLELTSSSKSLFKFGNCRMTTVLYLIIAGRESTCLRQLLPNSRRARAIAPSPNGRYTIRNTPPQRPRAHTTNAEAIRRRMGTHQRSKSSSSNVNENVNRNNNIGNTINVNNNCSSRSFRTKLSDAMPRATYLSPPSHNGHTNVHPRRSTIDTANSGAIDGDPNTTHQNPRMSYPPSIGATVPSVPAPYSQAVSFQHHRSNMSCNVQTHAPSFPMNSTAHLADHSRLYGTGIEMQQQHHQRTMYSSTSAYHSSAGQHPHGNLPPHLHHQQRQDFPRPYHQISVDQRTGGPLVPIMGQPALHPSSARHYNANVVPSNSNPIRALYASASTDLRTPYLPHSDHHNRSSDESPYGSPHQRNRQYHCQYHYDATDESSVPLQSRSDAPGAPLRQGQLRQQDIYALPERKNAQEEISQSSSPDGIGEGCSADRQSSIIEEQRGEATVVVEEERAIVPKDSPDLKDDNETSLAVTVSADSFQDDGTVNVLESTPLQTPVPVGKLKMDHSMSSIGAAPFKSPISICFDRMLGAAKMIQTPQNENGTQHSRKRKSFSDWPTESVPNLPTKPNSTSRAKRSILVQGEATRLEFDNPFRRIATETALRQKVIVQMAMQRESTNRGDSSHASSTLGEGFYWRDYPVLEEVLYKCMPNYYQVSSSNRQSKYQQSFNNGLVAKMRQAAVDAGLVFDTFFDDKKLRDRIRCFFKTHLQNAKKRLTTLQKHPTSADHQATLRSVIEEVQQNGGLAWYQPHGDTDEMSEGDHTQA
jgi:hypothetical protein